MIDSYRNTEKPKKGNTNFAIKESKGSLKKVRMHIDAHEYTFIQINTETRDQLETPKKGLNTPKVSLSIVT